MHAAWVHTQICDRFPWATSEPWTKYGLIKLLSSEISRNHWILGSVCAPLWWKDEDVVCSGGEQSVYVEFPPKIKRPYF